MTKPESFREAERTCKSCKHNSGSLYIFDDEVMLCQLGDASDVPRIHSNNYLCDLQQEYLKSHEVYDHTTCDQWQANTESEGA